MRPAKPLRLLGLALLVLALPGLLLAACEGYSQTGIKSRSQSDMNGGTLKVQVKKANGTAVQDIEVEAGYPGQMLETAVTLTVEKGSFRIELLGQDDEVTLALEARDGQTVSGQGGMMVDAFDEASYRVTAGEAENVEYTFEYTFR